MLDIQFCGYLNFVSPPQNITNQIKDIFLKTEDVFFFKLILCVRRRAQRFAS